MNLPNPIISAPDVNKRAIAQAFSRAAKTYDQFAALQRWSGQQLQQKIQWQHSGTVLDLGAGSGWFSRQLQQAGHQVVALDLSFAMLSQARQQQAAVDYLQADLDRLPLRAQSFDYVWSNLALQWSSNLRLALENIRRILRPGGQLAFATLGEGSLHEVDQAWQPLDGTSHINAFHSLAEVTQVCQGLGIGLESRQVIWHFASVRDALWSLKGIGATHLHAGRQSGVLTRQRLAQLSQTWPKDGQGYRLTYQLIFGVSQ